MIIEGSIKINGWLRPVDLEPGDCFIVEDDDSKVYLRTDVGYVNVYNGEDIEEDYNDELNNKVARKVNAKLVIEE